MLFLKVVGNNSVPEETVVFFVANYMVYNFWFGKLYFLFSRYGMLKTVYFVNQLGSISNPFFEQCLTDTMFKCVLSAGEGVFCNNTCCM